MLLQLGNYIGIAADTSFSFNTASGKCCCNIVNYLNKIVTDKGFNTASGKCCCNEVQKAIPSIQEIRVSIPQAVSAVATGKLHQLNNKLQSKVSIPQAVSAVATWEIMSIMILLLSFNTASGKCCCNVILSTVLGTGSNEIVSIPQAVSAVATKIIF